MSRLGRKPIPIPVNVKVSFVGGVVECEGPLGRSRYCLSDGFHVKEEGAFLVVLPRSLSESKSHHGLNRALLKNVIDGVASGYKKVVNLVGVGYRAVMQGDTLDLQLGYSRPFRLKIPDGIKVVVEKGSTIIISGIDKQLVGSVAASIKAMRPVEPYKGKGVHLEGEFIVRKAGKSSKGK